MQSPARQRKSSDGGPGHRLQPAGMRGAQTRPGAQPKVRLELGSSGAEKPVGEGHTVMRVVAVTVVPGRTTVGPGCVTVEPGSTMVDPD